MDREAKEAEKELKKKPRARAADGPGSPDHPIPDRPRREKGTKRPGRRERQAMKKLIEAGGPAATDTNTGSTESQTIRELQSENAELKKRVKELESRLDQVRKIIGKS